MHCCLLEGYPKTTTIHKDPFLQFVCMSWPLEEIESCNTYCQMFLCVVLARRNQNQKLPEAGENHQLSWQVMSTKQCEDQVCLVMVALPLRWKVMVYRYIYIFIHAYVWIFKTAFDWFRYTSRWVPFLPFCNHSWKCGLSTTSFPDQGPVEEVHSVKVSFQAKTLLQQEVPLFFLPFVNVACNIVHRFGIRNLHTYTDTDYILYRYTWCFYWGIDHMILFIHISIEHRLE